MEYASKTEHYLKVKKPLLERQRRARINKCLDALKQMTCEMQSNPEILRMDKAEMLESTIQFMRQQKLKGKLSKCATQQTVDLSSFRAGYMNAVNEVSRVLASSPGMTVEMGKSIMSHLGRNFNSLQQQFNEQNQQVAEVHLSTQQHTLRVQCPSMSPASSGYHSDSEDSYSSAANSPAMAAQSAPVEQLLWRPW